MYCYKLFCFVFLGQKHPWYTFVKMYNFTNSYIFSRFGITYCELILGGSWRWRNSVKWKKPWITGIFCGVVTADLSKENIQNSVKCVPKVKKTIHFPSRYCWKNLQFTALLSYGVLICIDYMGHKSQGSQLLVWKY